MDCAAVNDLIVAYHLGTVAEPEQGAVEAHFLTCTSCLKAYLALKRAMEGTRSDRPSDAARSRLRAAVEREVRTRTRPLAILGRRIPLYQGVVAAAVAATLALGIPGLVRRFEPRDVGRGVPAVDTSRARAASLEIY